jgi:ABC-type multidrug transport system permease subunit
VRSALLRDPSLIKIVTLYMKLGLVFTLAVLAIYFLVNRSGQADTPRLARLRELAMASTLSLLGYLQIAWIIMSMAAAWPLTFWRVIRRSDRALD